MAVKPTQKKHLQKPSLNPFTQVFIIFIFGVLPVLSYFILKPNEEKKALSIQQTREFASFIESNPKLAQRSVGSTMGSIADSITNSPLSPTRQPEDLLIEKEGKANVNASLTLEDRDFMYDIVSSWNHENFIRDHTWQDQVESLFILAERTKAPDVFDLIQAQIVEAKKDKDPHNQSRTDLWFDHYMRVEPRPEARNRMELLLHDNNNKVNLDTSPN